ncbi:hypothetical protein ACO0RG_001808 [Hanseniaspora osmophila]
MEETNSGTGVSNDEKKNVNDSRSSSASPHTVKKERDPLLEIIDASPSFATLNNDKTKGSGTTSNTSTTTPSSLGSGTPVSDTGPNSNPTASSHPITIKPKRQYRKSNNVASGPTSNTVSTNVGPKKTKKQLKLEEMLALEKELESLTQENGKLKSVMFKIKQEIELYSQYMSKYSDYTDPSFVMPTLPSTSAKGKNKKSTAANKRTSKKSISDVSSSGATGDLGTPMVKQPATTTATTTTTTQQQQQKQQQREDEDGLHTMTSLKDILINTSQIGSNTNSVSDGSITPISTKKRRIKGKNPAVMNEVSGLSSRQFLENVFSMDNGLSTSTSSASTPPPPPPPLSSFSLTSALSEVITSDDLPSLGGNLDFLSTDDAGNPTTTNNTSPNNAQIKKEYNQRNKLEFENENGKENSSSNNNNNDDLIVLPVMPNSPSSFFSKNGLLDSVILETGFSPMSFTETTTTSSMIASKPASRDMHSVPAGSNTSKQHPKDNKSNASQDNLQKPLNLNTFPGQPTTGNLEADDLMLMNTLKDVLSHM